jgi:hypothetical protein
MTNLENKDTSHRFTQFVNSDMSKLDNLTLVGRDGTIYDEGYGYKRPTVRRYSNDEEHSDPEDKSKSKQIGTTSKKKKFTEEKK